MRIHFQTLMKQLPSSIFHLLLHPPLCPSPLLKRERKGAHLVNLLHGAGTGLLKGRSVLGSGGLSGGRSLRLGINGKTESDHPVDSGGKVLGVGEGETRGQEGGLKEEVGEVSDGLVRLVFGDSALELPDDGVGGVELHSLLASHVRGHYEKTKSLVIAYVGPREWRERERVKTYWKSLAKPEPS